MHNEMETEKKPSLAECLQAATETRALVQDRVDAAAEVAAQQFGTTACCLVADENTDAVAGDALRGALDVRSQIIFPGTPRLHAEYRYVADILALLQKFKGEKGVKIFPVALGGGTVNDLTKRAASEAGIPYLCVPTAASVDGYTSSGAALLLDGLKQTMPCPAPRAVLADPAILAAAPAYLSSSGFGDLAGKLIAGTDWIIAEAVEKFGAPGTEQRDPKAWAMTQGGLRQTLSRSRDAARGDREAVAALFEALAITGFTMQYLHSSRPVSGTEHLLSHVWEMDNLSVDGVTVTHGHKVALGTLAAAAFTEVFFESPEPPAFLYENKPTRAEREAEVRRAFPAGVADGVVKTSLEKLMDEKSRRRMAEGVRGLWKDLRARVLERLPPYRELRALMAEALCPVLPEAIGLSRGAVLKTFPRAQMLRNRYTVIDLAWDLGLLDATLARLEESDLYLR